MFYSIQTASKSEVLPPAFARTAEHIVSIDQQLKMKPVSTFSIETETRVFGSPRKRGALVQEKRQSR